MSVLPNLPQIISRFEWWWNRWFERHRITTWTSSWSRSWCNMVESHFQITNGWWVSHNKYFIFCQRHWFYCLYCSNLDFGYDISDYRSIQPEYGTMEDFDSLIRKAQELGKITSHSNDMIKFILDNFLSSISIKASKSFLILYQIILPISTSGSSSQKREIQFIPIITSGMMESPIQMVDNVYHRIIGFQSFMALHGHGARNDSNFTFINSQNNK